MLKENKFLIGLGAITVATSGGLIFWGLGAGSDLETLQGEIATKKSALQRMEGLDPYPTPAAAKEKADNLAAVLTKARDARQKLLAFNPESIDDIPASEFSEKLKASVARVKALFPGEKDLPKEFTLGFESYAQYLPPEEATGELAFQLEALEYLFTQLAEAGGKEVVNLHRPKLPMEEGEDWPGAAPKKGARPSSGGRRPSTVGPRGRGGRAGAEVLPDVAHRLPVEVTFKASEETTRDFLNRLGNSDQYFFEVRLGRVENPAPIPSGEKSSGGSANRASDDGGIVVEGADDGGIVVEGADDGGIVVEGGAEPTADPLPEEPTSSEKIFTKISGNETLDVFLKLDLLIFMEDKEFPETK